MVYPTAILSIHLFTATPTVVAQVGCQTATQLSADHVNSNR
jgi:hypothetical protein